MEGWPSGNGTGLLNRGWGWGATRARSAHLPLMEDEPARAGPAWRAGKAGDRRGIRASVFRVWKLNRPGPAPVRNRVGGDEPLGIKASGFRHGRCVHGHEKVPVCGQVE